MEKSKITTLPFYLVNFLWRVARRASYFCGHSLPIELFKRIDGLVDELNKTFNELNQYEKSQKD